MFLLSLNLVKSILDPSLPIISQTMDYDKLSKDILDLDSKIRFVGVCDDSGETRFAGQRKGLMNLLSPDESKKSNLQAMARWGLRNSLARLVGANTQWQSMKKSNR
jgi:hypothetical protein